MEAATTTSTLWSLHEGLISKMRTSYLSASHPTAPYMTVLVAAEHGKYINASLLVSLMEFLIFYFIVRTYHTTRNIKQQQHSQKKEKHKKNREATSNYTWRYKAALKFLGLSETHIL